MASKREDILAAIKTALANTTGVGTRIYRSRTLPLAQRSQLPALIIEWSNDDASLITSAPSINWSLTVTVTILCSGDVPDQGVDATLLSMHSKIMNDVTLGGECMDIAPTTQAFETIDGDSPIGVMTCSYLVRYQTTTTDLAS